MLYLKLLTSTLLTLKLCHSLEHTCDYFSRNIWSHNPSVATSLYSIPDDFPRLQRPYLQHNSAHKLSLHHVIPHWLLKKFYNQVMKRNVNSEIYLFGSFLTRVMYAARRQNRILLDIYDDEFNKALWFAGHMQRYNAKSVQPGIRNEFWFAEGWCVALIFYTWLPGDLFFGPSPFMRINDPGSNFDTKAANIMQRDQYTLLWSLFLTMKDFVNSKVPKNLIPEQAPSQEFYDIINQLNRLVDYRLLYMYDPANWR